MLILIANPVKLIDAVAGTGAGDTFALPVRSVVLAWQTAFDVNPAAVSITLEVSIDGVAWTVLDTSTVVGGEVRTIQDVTAALFIRANVGTNTGDKTVTVTLVAKVANP